MNGQNFSQDYDFGQFETAQITEGVGTSGSLLVEPQVVEDDTVIVNPGVCAIEVQRIADGKTFKLYGELTADINLTVADTGVHPTWKGSIVATIDKAAVEDGSGNPEDGTAVFDIQYVVGLSTSALTDGEIETAIGSDYYWLRLYDVVQDPTISAGNLTDRREVFGVKNVNFPNNWPLRWRNNADTAYVDVLKLTTGDVAEFQTIPRNRSDRSFGNDYELIDKKYFQDNTITQVQTVTLGETCATEDVITFKGGGDMERYLGSGGSNYNVYGANWAGEYFVAPAKADKSMGFFYGNASKTGAPAGNFVMSLYLADGANKPTGAALATKNISANSFVSASGSFFKWAAPVNIVGGQKYVLVWSVPSGDGANYLRSNYTNLAGGETGSRLSSANSGATWTVDAANKYSQIGIIWAATSDGKAYKANITDPFLQGKVIGNLVSGGNNGDSREFNYLTCDLTGALQDDGNFYLSAAVPGELLTAVSPVRFGQAVADDQIRFSPHYEYSAYESEQQFGTTSKGDGDIFIPLPFKPDSFEWVVQAGDSGGGTIYVVGDEVVGMAGSALWTGAKSEFFVAPSTVYGGSGISVLITDIEVTDYGVWITLNGSGATVGPNSHGIRARKG